MLIKNVFIEGPDCSGKTTVINKIHRHTNYRYHMFDRSRMSQFIFSWMYERHRKEYSILYKEEREDLSNFYVVLLPDIEEVKRRFEKRGDEIHDEAGIEKVYNEFKKHVERSASQPNIVVIKSNKNQWVDVLGAIENYEKKKEFNVIKHLVYNRHEKEATNIRLTEVGKIADLKKDTECMKFKKEKEYYESIERDFIQKFIDEVSGLNEYSRKEQFDSRRFIYTSDTCISSIHAYAREDTLYFNAYMRSSNVDQVKHDYNFIKNMLFVFRNLFAGTFQEYFNYYKFNLAFGSAHVVRKEK